MKELSKLLLKSGPLYFRGDGVIVGDRLVVHGGDSVSFDTYFNSLSCTPFVKYTSLRRIKAVINIKGTATVSVWHGYSGGDELLASKEVVLTGEMPFVLPTNGVVYLKIQSVEDVEIVSGGFFADEEQTKDINIAIVICTYKREEFVKHNDVILANHKVDSPIPYTVFIVDNGNTLEAKEIKSVLIPNKNLGGSGGFTRGIIEAMKGDFTHILLMDDDIAFFPEIIDRIGAFLSFVIRDNVAVGGGMLRADKPSILHELGGLWNGIRISGLYQNIDISDRNNIIFDDDSADYSAWWCCCFPTDAVKKHGLPMPFFIKNDDVEYGVRCNFCWAFLNGVAVWHEPFDKKYSPHLEYYIKRNELVTNCVTVRRGWLSQFGKIARSAIYQTMLQRYFVLPYIFEACDDFFKGPDYLNDLDGEAQNSHLMAMRPKTYSGQKLTESGYDLGLVSYGKKKNVLLTVLTLNGQLLPTKAGKKNEYFVTEITKCTPGDFFLQRNAVQYNRETDVGFVTTQKRSKIIFVAAKLVKLFFRFAFTYGKVSGEYREKMPLYTSLKSWEKRLW